MVKKDKKKEKEKDIDLFDVFYVYGAIFAWLQERKLHLQIE